MGIKIILVTNYLYQAYHIPVWPTVVSHVRIQWEQYGHATGTYAIVTKGHEKIPRLKRDVSISKWFIFYVKQYRLYPSFIFKCFLFTWGKIFRLYLLFINTRTNMTLVIIIAIESNNKQTNLETFSNATRVDGNSKPCQTLSLWQDTFHTGFGSITISFGMIGIFLFNLNVKMYQVSFNCNHAISILKW